MNTPDVKLTGATAGPCWCRRCEDFRLFTGVWVVWAIDKLLTIALVSELEPPPWHEAFRDWAKQVFGDRWRSGLGERGVDPDWVAAYKKAFRAGYRAGLRGGV